MRRLAVLLALLLVAPALAQDKDQDDKKEEARLLKKARRQAEDGEKDEAFKLYWQLADLAEQRERKEMAIAALEEARPCAPDPQNELLVVRRLGGLYLEAGERAKCVKAYRRAARLAPEDASIQNSLGYALHLAGNEEESIAAFEKCIEVDSSNKEARYSLGVAARLCGKPMKALRAHEKLVESAKKGELARSWYFAWESELAKAEGKGISLASPASRQAVCDLEVAIDHVFLDELDEAEQEIQKLEKVDKDDRDPALAVAVDETARALELRPQHLQLHWLLGLLHEAKGDKEKAKAELEKFVAAEKQLRGIVKKAKEKLAKD